MMGCCLYARHHPFRVFKRHKRALLQSDRVLQYITVSCKFAHVCAATDGAHASITCASTAVPYPQLRWKSHTLVLVQHDRLVALMEPEAAVGFADQLQQLLDHKNSLTTDADLSLFFFDHLATYAAPYMVRHVLHNSTREPTPCGQKNYTQEGRRMIGLIIEHCTAATPCNECKSAIQISGGQTNGRASNMETLRALVTHLAVLPLVCHEGQRLMHGLKGRTKGAICSEAYRGIQKENGARNR